MAFWVAVLAWTERFAQFTATIVRLLVRRLRHWTYEDGVLTSAARRLVAVGGFFAILLVALLPVHRPGVPSASPAAAAPTASVSPSASASVAPSASPVAPVAPAGPVVKPMTKTGSKAVALTFDDGPWPTWTSRILDELKAAGVKATFCLIGRQVRANAALVRRMVAEGHTLCNHSWAHDLALGTRTPAQMKADIERTDAAIHAVVPGTPIRYFRQPGGTWTTAELRLLAALGKKPLGWSVDPWDWKDPGTSVIVSRVVSHTGTGSIVLMHDGGGDRAQSYAALAKILAQFKGKFTLVALPPVPL
jgi:peptidoglycan/xylan/chitin deacetylase (PgdA/CDA1 family)